MTGLESRFDALERRTRELEDIIAIYQLFATYGPSVDSLDEASVAALWTENGTFEPEHHVFDGAAAVGALVHEPLHQGYIAKGCAHVMSLPRVRLDGDRASATGYSRVYLKDGDHWRVERASANHWLLVRTEQGWKVERRLNRMLSGSAEARALLGTDLGRGAD